MFLDDEILNEVILYLVSKRLYRLWITQSVSSIFSCQAHIEVIEVQHRFIRNTKLTQVNVRRVKHLL